MVAAATAATKHNLWRYLSSGIRVASLAGPASHHPLQPQHTLHHLPPHTTHLPAAPPTARSICLSSWFVFIIFHRFPLHRRRAYGLVCSFFFNFVEFSFFWTASVTNKNFNLYAKRLLTYYRLANI